MDGALEDFDGAILAERAVIAQQANERSANQTGGAPAAPAANAPQGAGAGSSAPQSASQGGARPRTPRPTPSMPGGGQGGQGANDLPDAKDDDIIARQLREAAMAEQDPELREKLWEEYRRYKGR